MKKKKGISTITIVIIVLILILFIGIIIVNLYDINIQDIFSKKLVDVENLETNIVKEDNNEKDENSKWEIYEDIESQFYIGKYLGDKEDLIIPKTINDIKVNYLGNEFLNENVVNVTLLDNIIDIGERPFTLSNNLQNIYVDENNSKYKDIDGVLFSKDGKTLYCYPSGKLNSTYTIPENVTTIKAYAFCSVKNLEELIIPNTVNNIVFNYFGDFIYDCNNLQNIYVDENNSKYKDIDGVLFNKNSENLYYYPEGRKEKSYTIPVTVNKINLFTFNNTELENIYVDKNNNTYKDIDGVLFSKYGKYLYNYPNGKTNDTYVIPTSVTRIFTSFEKNKYLKTIITDKKEYEIRSVQDVFTDPIGIEVIYGEKSIQSDEYEEKNHTQNFFELD